MNVKQRLARLTKKLGDRTPKQLEPQDRSFYVTCPEDEDVIMAELKQKYGPDFNGSGVTILRVDKYTPTRSRR